MSNNKESNGWDQITGRILKAYNEISKSINPSQLTRVKLTSSQIKVMVSFEERDSFTMTELSTLHSVSVSTMTSMVDRLIQSGYVVREKDDADRRIVRVSLSASGKRALRHLMVVRKQALEQFLLELDDSEVKRFLQSIENVAYFLAKAKKNRSAT